MPVNLLKMFKQATQKQTQQSEPSQPSNQPAPAIKAPTSLQGSGNESPLDWLNDFVQNTNNPATTQQRQKPSLNIPQDKLAEIAKGLSFTNNLPQEALQAVLAGDLSKLPDLLDAVGQGAYTTAMQHNMGLVNKFIDDRMSFEREDLGDYVGRQLTTRNFDSQLGNVHPYARKMMQDLAADLRSKYPDATEDDIQHTVWETMREMGTQFSNDPKTVQEQQKRQAAAPNWDSFGGFEGDNPQSGNEGPVVQ